jgi:hypothetical protein
MLGGKPRRSYVLWQEVISPLLVIEYVSGDGQEERDTTPFKGKFWVYERAIKAGYYAIYEVEKASVEVYRLDGGRYRLVEANAAGRYPIEPLGIELGIWQGTYRGMELPWLRAWDSASGAMLPSTEEREERQRQRANTEERRANEAESLLDETRELLQEETERAETERRNAADVQRRAEDARKQAEDEKRRAEDAQKQAEDAQKQAEDAQKQADDQKRRAEDAQQRATKLAERLRALGVDPDAA